MLAILSPAKIQNFTSLKRTETFSVPQFITEAESLVDQLRDFSVSELVTLLKVNSSIATENAERFLKWHVPFTRDNAKQAIFVYDGEAFRGLNAEEMSSDTIAYAQNHLRLFSSLYGLLRPLDLIQAYRLDQLTKLKPAGYTNLNQFWKERMTDGLIEALQHSDNPDVLLNLASNEYFKVLDRKRISARIINFEFLQYQPDTDKYKQVTIYTKKARGQLVRFVMEHNLRDPEDLKAFNTDGYFFSHEHSSADNLVFVR